MNEDHKDIEMTLSGIHILVKIGDTQKMFFNTLYSIMAAASSELAEIIYSLPACVYITHFYLE